MNKTPKNWFHNPSKKTVVIVGLTWLFGAILLVIATTNLFAESFFQRKYFITNCLLFVSALTVVNVYANYLKNKRRPA